MKTLTLITLLLFPLQEEVFGRKSASSSSVATSLMDDTSPETAMGKKSKSTFIPSLVSKLSDVLYRTISLNATTLFHLFMI